MPKIMYRNTAYGEIISDSNIKYGDFDCNYIEPPRTIDDYIENGTGNLTAIESNVQVLTRKVIFHINSLKSPIAVRLPNAVQTQEFNDSINVCTSNLYLPKLETGCFLSYASGFKHIDLPSLVQGLSFFFMPDIVTFNAPLLQTIYRIHNCSNIQHVYLPQCTTYYLMRNAIASSCQSLKTVNLPSFADSDLTGALKYNPNLELVDFGSLTAMNSTSTSTSDDPFYSSPKFKTLIIRTPTLCTLSTINVFRGSPFASNGSGGTLYVPQALISSYQNATNWKTILGYTKNKILPLEGSPYETPSTSYDHY